MMLFHTDGKPLKSHLTPLIHLVFHLLLTHFCGGELQLIGQSQPIVATLGHDIILPCHLEPAEDAAGLTLEWTRPDLDPRFVHVWRSGVELVGKKHKSFKGRTSLFIDELKVGNISLKLSKVKIADQGTYRCFIPALEKQSLVQLNVASDAISSPVLTLAGIDEATSGVVLQCECAGWYPEPEVLWLDAEGNLLSAGPTETVRGPDDLYTVSSRLTVEKRHSNSFTCRVQQKDIHQTRETQIHVPDDFFKVQSSSSPTVIGLAVSLALCIVFFVVWQQRKNKIKNKRNHSDETDKGEKKNHSEEERVRELLMTDETVTVEVLNMEKGGKKTSKKQKSKQQRREEADKELQTLKEELETKKNEVETKQAELQKLREEKQRNENELQNLKAELENKKKELEGIQTARGSSLLSWLSQVPSKEQQHEAEQEVETLKKKLETHETTSDTKIKELEKQLQEEKNKRETAEEEVKKLKELKTKLEDQSEATNMQWMKTNEELKEAKHQLKNKNAEISWFKGELVKQLGKEQQSAKEAEKHLNELLIKNEKLEKLQEEKNKRETAEREVKKLKGLKTESPSQLRADKVSEQDDVSATQSSTTGLLIETDPRGKYVRVRNTSPEDQQLGGWKIKLEINNNEPLMFTFDQSLTLKAGEKVTMWVPGCSSHCPPYDLVWKDLKTWSSGDRLQVALIRNT